MRLLYRRDSRLIGQRLVVAKKRFSVLSRLIKFGLLFTLIGTGMLLWYPWSLRNAEYPIEFRIEPRSSLRVAARQIEAGGLNLGRWRFELLARLLGRAQDVKAGSYAIDAPITPLGLLEKLTRGDVTQGEVAFIEGWTIFQVRAALASAPSLRHDSDRLDMAGLLQAVGANETHPEGLFFPDTYLYPKGSSDLEVLRRAYRAMQRHLAREWANRAPNLPFDRPYAALTLASIVEKETGRAAEREMIAGTLVNRLRIGMRLQVDPTIIYGMGDRFDGNLRRRDLEADGPYNTYTRGGLPPSPIAMPGLAALRATLHPAATETLYYVARGDGSSQFSRTLEEHNRAVVRYQLKQ
jgi:UPF0755 protein